MNAASSADPRLTGLCSLPPSDAFAPSAPKPPKMTDTKLLFMALHIIYDRIAPEEPTSAPVIISARLPKVKPKAAAAQPEYEFSIETTTGMSAPPIGIINRKPIKNVKANNTQIKLGLLPPVFISITIVVTIQTSRAPLMRCLKGSKIGAPDILPFNLAKAITEPEKVIAPMAAPKPNSKRLAGFIPLSESIPKLSGLKKAAIATNTAAKPTNE